MSPPGHVFIAPGDITRLAADAIAFSASNALGRDGNLCSSFEANVPGFADWYRQLRRTTALPITVGTTFWMPLAADRNPRGLVVVVSTGRDPEPDKAGLAVRNAVARAVAELRGSGRTDRLLIALPAFRVGKGGDRNQRLQSARAQIQAAAAAVATHPDIDLAFLTYTPTLYHFFLEARRQVLGDTGAGLPRFPALEQALRDRACVLFVGAGMSAGAGLPGWNALVARLSRELGLDPSPDLDNLDVAQWYREKFGHDKLASVLRETFGATGLPTLAHYLLMALPVRHVITTNYDRLLEDTLTALKRHPTPVIHQEDVVQTGGTGVYVVKMHGDAEHADEIVLSREDYDAFFTRRPAMALLLEGLLLNQTFFFVGYSLRDINFRQVFSRIARMLRKSRRIGFATSFEATGQTAEYLKQQWRQQGLELLPIEGKTLDEQKVRFLHLLDALSERVTLPAPPLVLAPDVQTSPRLAGLRGLLEQVGSGVEALGQESALSREEVDLAAEVLAFLTAHGWRPSGKGARDLCRLYEQLAGAAVDVQQRRRLLIAALSHAEAFADVCRLRQALVEADPPG